MFRTSKRAFGFGALIQKIKNINIKWESKFHGHSDFDTAEYAWYLREPLQITAFCEGFTGDDLNYRETIYNQYFWWVYDDWKLVSDFEYDAYDEHLESWATGNSWRVR